MLHIGDVRDILPTLESESVNCIVTSPPYWGLRDYGVDGQMGLESTPQEWVDGMVAVFRECRRVLRKDGTMWVNVGDSYAQAGAQMKNTDEQSRAITQSLKNTERSTGQHGGWESRASRAANTAICGLKPKDLCLMPFRLALALQDDGWYVRSHIIWAKKSPMPESCTDRPTSAHESIFMLTKSAKYWYDADAVREPSKRARTVPGGNYVVKGLEAGVNGGWAGGEVPEQSNLRNVWHLGPEPFAEAHFATFPSEIPKRCILAGCPKDGTVLDPFMGSGTTAKVAQSLGRKWVGIELNPEYAKMVEDRAQQYGMAI